MLCRAKNGSWLLAVSWLFSVVGNLAQAAIDFDVNDENKIMKAASTALGNAYAFYIGDQPDSWPGMVAQPYYWWECGALFMTTIEHWSITKDDKYNDVVMRGMIHQSNAPERNFEPQNESKQLGNDDQVFWGFASMAAAEFGFPNPPEEAGSWLGFAQAIFNRQTGRWDDNCKGGMPWQIIPTNPGYFYKNIAANGGYFHLAARLARYTNNGTYEKFANRMWDWLEQSAMFQTQKDGKWIIYDGFDIHACSNYSRNVYTYNPGNLLMGAAYLYNYTTGSDQAKWQDRINRLLDSYDLYFVAEGPSNVVPKTASGDIIAEIGCETVNPPVCKQDQPAFKGFAMRWLSMTTVLAPFTHDRIWPRIQKNAAAAAQTCTGSATGQAPGTSCGRRWYQGGNDGQSGLGEQMSAASVFQNLLVAKAGAPFTAKSGGNSTSNPGGGEGGTFALAGIYTRVITVGDKFGASVVTILSVGLGAGAAFWLLWQ